MIINKVNLNEEVCGIVFGRIEDRESLKGDK
jgi:hypothetical protein